MTNKLVVILNSLKVPKIKKILLYGMKFLVPPPDPRSLCPPTECVETPSPPHRKKFLGTPLVRRYKIECQAGSLLSDFL